MEQPKSLLDDVNREVVAVWFVVHARRQTILVNLIEPF